MMDMITCRASPPARAESHRSKGSRELARPGPSLLEALGLRQPVANRGHCSQVAVVIRIPEVPSAPKDVDLRLKTRGPTAIQAGGLRRIIFVL